MSTSRTSRTSTEARFRRGFVITVVVLAMLCAGFGVASALQGPKLQGARVDTAAAVVAPSTLRLVLDEAVKKVSPKQIVVTPKVPITVSTDGDVVLVRFSAALDYGTRYSIAVKNVSSAGGGAVSTLAHAFRTPYFAADWVQRSDAGDHIMRAEPGGKPVEVFDGKIQDFLTLPDAMFIVTPTSATVSSAKIVADDGINHEDITLPAEGRIDLLEYVGSTVLYTFTSADSDPIPEYDDTLFQLDLSGTHLSTPVLGLDKKPMAVDGIQRVPGTTSVFLHARSGDLLHWTVGAATPPTLLGSYTKMGQVASDGHRISATDAFGSLIYDTTGGKEVRANPSPIDGVVPYIADIAPLSGGRWLERAALPTADGSSFVFELAIDNGTTGKALYRPPAGSIMIDFRTTANERYVLVEVASTIQSDGSLNPRPLDRSTIVIDLESGKTVATWNGGDARW